MKIIAIIGKTATGKDTVARHLKKVYDIDQIVSYATRPKRETETEGVEHYFISKEEMSNILAQHDKLLAYTKFPKTGYEYCASKIGLDENKTYTYIINPDGVFWLLEHQPNTELTIICLNCDENIIREHAKNRGDNVEAIEERIQSEREQFDSFFEDNTYKKYMIDAGISIDYTLQRIDEIVAKENLV